MYVYDFLGYISVFLSAMAFLEGKNLNRMIFLGMVSAIFFSISLYGYDGLNGVLVSVFSIFIKGSVLYSKKTPTFLLKVLSFIVAMLYFFYFNTEGIFGILPAMTIIIIAFADTQKSLLWMKIWYIPSALIWLTYAIYLESPSAIVYDIIGLFAIGVFIVKHKKTQIKNIHSLDKVPKESII